jgi:hypothetical protein
MMIEDETLVIATSCFAAFCALVVILVCQFVLDISNKRFNKIIFYMAVSDFCANCATPSASPPRAPFGAGRKV